MKHRLLGLGCKIEVSELGLGTSGFGERIDAGAATRAIHRALDLGVTLFDTADAYGHATDPARHAERILGAALKGSARESAIIATKFGGRTLASGEKSGASRAAIRESVEASLRRLDTDRIDLYQLHVRDPKAPIEETLATLDELVREGKVRAIGCSNLPPWLVVHAHWLAREMNVAGFVSSQNELSLLNRGAEKELLPALDAVGLKLIAYYPLAAGLLTGKYRRGEEPSPQWRLAKGKWLHERFMNDANLAATDRLASIAAASGRSLLELAFGWLLAKREVASVIAGASSVEQLEANVRALERPLSTAELEALAQAKRS